MTHDRRTVSIFISSTFRDMDAERDHLVKVVFPALRERLDPFRIDVIDIDLRWGITEAQAEDGRVLPLCLEQIEACRPFFVGLLGQRYGWVPGQLPRDVVQRYPSLQHSSGKSITELEILYAVLDAPGMNERGFFYFRDPRTLETVPTDRRAQYEDTDPVLQEQLRKLKHRIVAGGFRVMNGYPARWNPDAWDRRTRLQGRIGGLEAFGERVLADLWEAIRAEHDLPAVPPRESTASSLQREHSFHQRFMDARLEGYVGRDEIHRALLDSVDDDDGRPLLLVGPSGSGKSSILARLVRDLQIATGRGERRDLLVIAHFAGASPRSTSLRALLTRVLETLELAYGIGFDAAAEITELIATFRRALEQVPAGKRVVVVIDAVNQFDERDLVERLQWLPRQQPPNVRVVLSCIRAEAEQSETVQAAERRGYRMLQVDPLSDAERRDIARIVPLIVAKTLDEQQLELLLSNPATRNPLYLRVALEELRGFGSFEQVGSRIAQFPYPLVGRDAVEAIFLQVMERLEEDFRPALVRDVLTVLASARRGLTEPELRRLVEQVDLDGELFAVLRQLRPYLMRRADVITFFHDALAGAARARYLAESAERRAAHLRLADFFDEQSDFLAPETETLIPNVRKVDELPWQLLEGGDAHRLAEHLQRLTFVDAKAKAGLVDELAADYRTAAEQLDEDDPCRHVVRVLWRALHHDIAFLLQHPECVFQVLWNRGWWYDAPQAAHFFDMRETAGDSAPPWRWPGAKVHVLLERWREERSQMSHESAWVRRLLPPGDLYDAAVLVLQEAFDVGEIAWSPDGGHLASASEDRVRVWQLDGAGDALVLRTARRVECVAWSPDGTRLASADYDTLYIWDPGESNEPLTLPNRDRAIPYDNFHDAQVRCVAWSPDGTRLASIAWNRSVRVWRVDDWSDPEVLPHDGAVRHIAWSPDGQYLATAADDLVRVWALHTNRDPLTLHYSRVATQLAWSPDGEQLAISVASYGRGPVLVWKPGERAPLVLQHGEGTRHAAWAPDARRIASAARDCVVVWSLENSSTSEPLVLRPEDPGTDTMELGDVEWSPDGSRVTAFGTVGKHDGGLWVWSLRGSMAPLTLQRSQWIRQAAWSPDGSRLATCCAVSREPIRVWTLEDIGEPALTPRGHLRPADHVAWSPTGHFLASVGDHTARIWSADGIVGPRVLTADGSRLTCVAWDPEGTRVAIGHADGGISLWPIDGGSSPYILPGHPRRLPVRSIAWSPDGTAIASAAADNSVYVWRPGSQSEPLILRAGSDDDDELIRLIWMAWSFDGALLAVSHHGPAPEMSVWNARTGSLMAEEPRIWDGHPRNYSQLWARARETRYTCGLQSARAPIVERVGGGVVAWFEAPTWEPPALHPKRDRVWAARGNQGIPLMFTLEGRG